MTPTTPRVTDPVQQRFVRRVRSIRGFRGISQTRLAALAGISRQILSEVETGRRRLTLGEAVAIAEALQVDLNLLVGDEPFVVERSPKFATQQTIT